MWTIYKLDCNFFSLYRLCFSVKMLNNYFLCSGCQFYTFSTYKKISLCVLSCKLVMWLPAWVSETGVSVASSLSGLPWWWPALGGTSTWSRSCCATAPTLRWETKMAGTPSTSPAGRAILWSYSTCLSSRRTSGGWRARHAGLRCTLRVGCPQIPSSRVSICGFFVMCGAFCVHYQIITTNTLFVHHSAMHGCEEVVGILLER